MPKRYWQMREVHHKRLSGGCCRDHASELSLMPRQLLDLHRQQDMLDVHSQCVLEELLVFGVQSQQLQRLLG
jgi:hypothetical protein